MYISFTLLNAKTVVIIIGITNDLEKRLWEHNTGHDENSYTYSRRPVELKYFETFTDVNQAIAERSN